MVQKQTTFKAPLGTDPVVVDLQGLGKGFAWVNGHNIGRYWPSYLAEDGCSTDPCDYRGPYDDSKCVSNCGHPTQRWYCPHLFFNLLIFSMKMGCRIFNMLMLIDDYI